MSSRLLTVGTDGAELLLFHPDDIQHRSQAPSNWYSYGFAYQAESRAGRLIAFHTAGDGGFAVRMTTGELTPEEGAHRRGHWDFPLLVRHGRVLLDGGSGVPSRTYQDGLFQEGGWYNLPNGTYRVTVHPIVSADRSTERDGSLPHYVITFAPMDGLNSVPAALTPPWLSAYASDGEPGLGRDPADKNDFTWPDGDPPPGLHEAYQHPGFVPPLPHQHVAGLVSVGFGQRIQNRMQSTLRRMIRGGHVAPDSGEELIALNPLEGETVALARVVGVSGGRAGQPFALHLDGRYVARVEHVMQTDDGLSVTVQPLPRPDLEADADLIARLQGALRQAGMVRPDLAFEVEWLSALRTPEAVTVGALWFLGLQPDDMLSLYAASATHRAQALLERIAAGAQFRSLSPRDMPLPLGWAGTL